MGGSSGAAGPSKEAMSPSQTPATVPPHFHNPTKAAACLQAPAGRREVVDDDLVAVSRPRES